jgi:hypothetical protein
MRRVKSVRRLIAVAIPAVMYTASMFLTVAILPVSGTGPLEFVTIYGHEAFEGCLRCFYLVGAWDLARVIYASAWMANPALWCALVFLAIGWRRMAMICALVACALALGVLYEGTWFIDCPGYWFWLGSMVAAVLSGCFLLKRTPPAYADDYGRLPRQPG